MAWHPWLLLLGLDPSIALLVLKISGSGVSLGIVGCPLMICSGSSPRVSDSWLERAREVHF